MKNKHCLRCGSLERDLRKKGFYHNCKVYGKDYGNHKFNNTKESKYIFAYSGIDFEGGKEFSSLKSLREFLKTIPEHDLKNSMVMKRVKNYYLVGYYTRDNKMINFK